MLHRKPRLPRRRPRPNASSRASQSILSPAKREAGAEKPSRNASEWIAKARSLIPGIVWSLTKREMPSVIQKTGQLARKPPHLGGQVCLLLTEMQGHRIPGERSNNGVGNGGPDNSGAKTGESGDHHNQAGAAGTNKSAVDCRHASSRCVNHDKFDFSSRPLRSC